MGGIARRKNLGVTFHNRQKSYQGYTYLDPYFEQNRAYLIDNDGDVVHYWDLPGMFADWTELLPNGNVLAPVRKNLKDGPKFPGFCGATIYEVDWDGNIVWEYEDDFQHHAVKRLDNGNTLILRVIQVPPDMAKQVKGGMPGSEDKQEKYKGFMWTDNIQEVDKSGNVVWEWNSHEHLDFDEDPICALEERSEWSHGNNMELFPNGDLLVAFRCIHQVCRIEKSTGKILWKWGRDQVHHMHNPNCLENGNILMFDNGMHIPDSYVCRSRLVEVNPETNEIVWTYSSVPETEFFSTFCGGVQRLPNGNTLACETEAGRLFEVDTDGNIVWEYMSPFYSLNQQVGDDPRDLGHSPRIHRTTRFPKDYSAFKGRDLDPAKHKVINQLFGSAGLKGVK
ncbi:MAG: PQQ-binding-like beta-propeller repeat protein [Candidatus Marinimicrobia bacterium]|jgi:predicted Rdx family selenoprotein|nr:PQQ-binding-like beta-propeller repeat protein [Candidatus Neomarinimicrobiota bacterium]MBT3823572.1 PQQ-binding-like beta-propeller repeat protein [Candidatus Neomarinimicrobiota bacterium]MBT4129569.1 PQQ-binding-like beta-propeller repeat protein [Candidatus Neomarinimicrobiota bacterium]MBT4295905.1 PQQ-binding-like beta-propeller repeat protein [Candidatus Neomarinimicrobiota bacterium]MBT4420093.1 PQQ-binding-like beta-propeller repeat protein [Candidatus Neomarinimicrobiota bacterium